MRVRLVTEIRLNRKQRLYVEGVLAGKSRRQAALAADCSTSKQCAVQIRRMWEGGPLRNWSDRKTTLTPISHHRSGFVGAYVY